MINWRKRREEANHLKLMIHIHEMEISKMHKRIMQLEQHARTSYEALKSTNQAHGRPTGRP